MKKLVLFFMLLMSSVAWAADTNVDVDANGAVDTAFGGTNQTSISADSAAILGAANNAAIKALLSVDDLVTLSGVADGAVNLGAFTGSTIADNQTVKVGLQSLETAVEGKEPALAAASKAEMEAGTEAGLRSMSPLRVGQAITALAGAAVGTVTKVGDCTGGDCLDGSSDGGTYIRLYDGNSHYTQLSPGDSAGNLTFTLPTAAPGGNDAILVVSTTGVMSTRASTVYQVSDAELAQIAALSPAQGDVLYYNGSAWVLLTAGVNGQYLKTQGAAANPTWGDPAGSGDMTAVGNFTSGAAFTEADTTNGILYFEGTTNNEFEVALTARNATADRTAYLPDSDGDILVGPANGFGTDLRLTKTNGTGSLMQITGVTVDGSNNVSGVGTLSLTSGTATSFLAVGSDPADAGSIRLPNAGYIYSEADAAGTDISVIGVDSAERIQIGASGASGVTITPAVTVTGVLTANGGIVMGTGDGFTVNSVNLLSGDELDGTKIKDADYGDVTIDAAGAWTVENDSHTHGSTTITLASTNLSDTSALAYLAGAQTFTANNVFGNADTDTLTVRSMIIGGNSREVQINAGVRTAPTYPSATPTQDLYVKGNIETPAAIYAASVNTGTGTDGSRELVMTSNTGANIPTATGNKLYFIDNVLKVVEDGTAKDVPLPADSITWTGAAHSFTGVTSMSIPTATPDANGEIAINNTNETLLLYINSGLKTLDFTGDSSGYILKSNGSGVFTLQEDATGGTPTLDSIGDPSGDTTVVMGSGEEVNFDYTGDFTTGSQFRVRQVTGNPSGGVLFEAIGTDTDITIAKLGDGTNGVQVSATGALTAIGSGTIVATGLTAGTAPVPASAGGVALGSATAEWDHLYLHDSAVIYGQADQSATLTSSASKWTANNFGITTAATMPATISNAAAATWTLMDNQASGMSFGAAGAADILKIGTLDAGATVAVGGAFSATTINGHTLTAGSSTFTGTAGQTYTFPTTTATLARTDAGQTFTGVQAFTAPTVATSIAPASADGATLGTTALEFSDLYLADGGVIYGQNDQSATLTSSASLWTANNLAVSTQFRLPSSDAAPTSTAGYIRHDSTVTNHANGALRWHDGTNVRHIVDMVAATAEGCTDEQVLAYEAGTDLFYCKTLAGGGDLLADGTVPMTAALVPNAANTVALGSTAAEWADIYLGDGAIIYGQNDQSNTITSSATGWSVNLPFGLYSANDPDVATEGKITWDANGDVLRGHDGTRQVAVARVQEEIHVTVVKPQDMADAVRDAFLVWSNESGMSFVITGWKAWAGTDDTTLNIEETDADGQNNVTVDAVEIGTNGTGVFYASDTTITAATIENGHLLWLDFDDTDDPSYVKLVIYGYYNSDVN